MRREDRAVCSANARSVPKLGRARLFFALLAVWGGAVELGMATPASADAWYDAGEVQRYAVIIGANRGRPSDTPLRYAVRDARRMAAVLKRYGDLPEANTVLLEEPNAKRIHDTILRQRARIKQETRGRRSLLVVYYSGHGDSRALYSGGTELAWRDLEAWVGASSADLRILVLDACRSGAVTRVKGTRARPLRIPHQVRGFPEGFAVLSSTTAGEDAQESDELRASFFTHHFLSALRGVADNNRDGFVTLEEAYRYTANRTVWSSAATVSGIQHPTYRYQLRGRSSVRLTRVRRARGNATLVLDRPGQYVFFEDDRDGLVAIEAQIVRGRSRELWLPAGNYFVRVRDAKRLYEGTVRIRDATTNEFRFDDLERVEYAQLVRKGDGTRRQSFALSVWGGYLLPIFGYRGSPQGAFMGSWVTSAITVDAEFSFAYGWRDETDTELAGQLFEPALSVCVRKVFDVGQFSLSFGARAGAAFLIQRFDAADRLAPTRRAVAPFLGLLLRADVRLPRGWFLGWEPALTVATIRSTDGLGDSQRENPLRFSGRMGFGTHW